MAWNPEALPDLPGRTFAVTGGTAGIGYFIAEQLAGTGAHVVLLGRAPERLRTAVTTLRARVGSARLSTIPLDLTDLGSVAGAAERLVRLGRVDALIENAGITAPGPVRRSTAQGFELAMGTNHFGHFALTALAMPVLTASAARIVSMGSLITRLRRFDLDDLQSVRSYSDFRAYTQSKHAVQSFGLELDRRLRAAGSPVRSIVAQPGFSLDRSTPDRPGISTRVPAFRLLAPVCQGKDHGAWPAVRAAADPSVEGGAYLGPARLGVGRPVPGTAPATSRDPALASRLWTVSEELTGIPFRITAQ
ncbi:NADP-dependent 3-hydroxy acid dehydrogenase YdfG [Amycolatopsis sulphurea]|uniref:NADP-dependent 3-hydroxy acid dehydrogenase YdfG n=1 Tax=Amycolatopsis sulphurea TaxID=76022 RepID=A0A2A9FGU2_9PSEU|nr:SDR family NAD(P)-dependent oxidoreductase [Amycolatopsis sulphurea]PFG49792.1 NADP-dependent 3-hydroxy acid dehydrogenase YdfG [Amycolatopsis sulphurea]